MFTGIVEEVGSVISAQARRMTIAARIVLQGMEPGGSISVNGVCLTVTSLTHNFFSVDIMPETLGRTNLGLLRAEDEVNLERPLTLEKPLGGHLVQGHVDNIGRVAAILRQEGEVAVRFEASPEIMCYLVEKGFIAVDGVSLTVVAKDATSFLVSLVDYTRQHTTLGKLRVGDSANLEVDIIAKYVAELSQARHTGITVDFLREQGFSVG